MSDLSSPVTYSSALGSGDCPAGAYHIDVESRRVEWSDGLYRLHGYERGEVVPSMELILSHKHPEDRPRAEEMVAEVFRHGGHFSMYHRVIDVRGKLHKVLTSGEGLVDDCGKVTAVGGVMVDLTATLQRETEAAAREAVERATATRSIIDQARGLLMGRLQVSADEAFELLVGLSSRSNMKLAVVAADLVALAEEAGCGNGTERLDLAVRAVADGKHLRRRDAHN